MALGVGFLSSEGPQCSEEGLNRVWGILQYTHRPQSSSFLGLPYRVLNMNPKKELLWGLWVAI